ncbi:hypothetical protein MJO29_014027, partial [Puccinia striiformis f. sp. tritici]
LWAVAQVKAKHHGQQPSSLTTSRSQNPWRNRSKLHLQPLHIGTLRYDLKNSKIGRITLLPAYHCSGIGKQMMISFERWLIDNSMSMDQGSSLSLPDSSTPVQLCLHSQLPMIGFYFKIGHEPVGPTFIDVDQPKYKIQNMCVKRMVLLIN